MGHDRTPGDAPAGCGDNCLQKKIAGIGDRRVVGEIDRRAAARERFEKAILEGRTAGLLDQERASLFTQELGNVPPGTEVTVTLTIDQPLAWVSEERGGATREGTGSANRHAAGGWEWRFPTVVAPRYLGAPGRVPDAGAITQDVADGPTGARVAIDFVIRDRIPEGRGPDSPSHRLTVGRAATDRGRAAAGADAPPSPDRPPAGDAAGRGGDDPRGPPGGWTSPRRARLRSGDHRPAGGGGDRGPPPARPDPADRHQRIDARGADRSGPQGRPGAGRLAHRRGPPGDDRLASAGGASDHVLADCLRQHGIEVA